MKNLLNSILKFSCLIYKEVLISSNFLDLYVWYIFLFNISFMFMLVGFFCLHLTTGSIFFLLALILTYYCLCVYAYVYINNATSSKSSIKGSIYKPYTKILKKRLKSSLKKKNLIIILLSILVALCLKYVCMYLFTKIPKLGNISLILCTFCITYSKILLRGALNDIYPDKLDPNQSLNQALDKSKNFHTNSLKKKKVYKG